MFPPIRSDALAFSKEFKGARFTADYHLHVGRKNRRCCPITHTLGIQSYRIASYRRSVDEGRWRQWKLDNRSSWTGSIPQYNLKHDGDKQKYAKFAVVQVKLQRYISILDWKLSNVVNYQFAFRPIPVNQTMSADCLNLFKPVDLEFKLTQSDRRRQIPEGTSSRRR